MSSRRPRSAQLDPNVNWEHLEPILTRFEGAWRRGERPRVEDYLEGSGAQRRALLIELIHEDLECRPGAGEEAGLEPYLERYPELREDFGLALRSDAELTMTLDGHIVGTPAYMSPEQAAGKGHSADQRSDVYSLGVVLYELLCGELPFRGSRLMILQQVLMDDPRPPRKLNDKVPRDLETICLKCLRKEPDRRYATARALAEDLRRFKQGDPITARPVGRIERALKWARRRPAAAALVAVTLFAMLVVAAGLAPARICYDMERRTTGRARKRPAPCCCNSSRDIAWRLRSCQTCCSNLPRKPLRNCSRSCPRRSASRVCLRRSA